MKHLFLGLFMTIYFQIFSQNVGIGTSTPTQKLDVAGNVKADTAIINSIKMPGNTPQGKAIISDQNGVGSWQYLPQYKAHNGLNISNDTIQWGGILSDTTLVDLNQKPLTFLNIEGGNDYAVISQGSYNDFTPINSTPISQTFTSINSLQITAIHLYLEVNGASSISIAVLDDNDSVIVSTGATFTSAFIDWFSLDFDSIKLKKDHFYTINITATGDINIFFNDEDPYPAGESNIGMGIDLAFEMIGRKEIDVLFFKNELVGIGTANPDKHLDVNGDINFMGNLYKNNILYKPSLNINDLVDARSDNDGSQNGSSIYLGTDAGTADDQSNNQNIGIGYQSLNGNTTGFSNVGIGWSSMQYNTTGNQNVGLGWRTLGYNTTGTGNIALGSSAMLFNTTGFGNTALGFWSLINNTTGHNNVGVGLQTLRYNNTGSGNVAIGPGALYNNTSTSFLVAIGDSTLFNTSSITALYNTAVGSKALFSNTEGSGNTAVGNHALYLNTTGLSNCAVGSHTLYSNTTGQNNTAFGGFALHVNTEGNSNVGIGSQALYNNTTGNHNVGLGALSLTLNTIGNENTGVGRSSLANNINGNQNTACGYEAMYYNDNGGQNTALGTYALKTNVSGSRNTACGYMTLLYNNTGVNNVANGYQALYSNTTGSNNIAQGYQSLYFNTTASQNIAIGHTALHHNTTGMKNTAVGTEALYSNSTGQTNVAIGFNALYYNTNGSQNTAEGESSLYSNTGGTENTANGARSLYSNTTGDKNTAAGMFSLFANITGNNNTGIGYSANSIPSANTNSTGIGYDAEPGASNTVRLGNSAVSTIGGFANWTNVSDARFKTNIQENVVGLDFITKLRPVTYQLNMDAIAQFLKTPDSLRLADSEALKAAEIQTGFIAQEVEVAAKSVGYEFHGVDKPKNEESHYGLRYAEFVVPLVKAVQEQQKIIENQEIILSNQSIKIDELKLMVEKQAIWLEQLNQKIKSIESNR